jgi:hypothetical protein
MRARATPQSPRDHVLGYADERDGPGERLPRAQRQLGPGNDGIGPGFHHATSPMRSIATPTERERPSLNARIGLPAFRALSRGPGKDIVMPAREC